VVKVVTDSCSDITPQLAREPGISVVPHVLAVTVLEVEQK